MWCCHAQVCLGTEFLVEESEERGREWAVDTGSPGHTGGEAGGGVVTRWWHNTVSPTVTLLHVQLTLIRQFQAWTSLPALQGWRESWICSKYAVHPFYTIIRIFNWNKFSIFTASDLFLNCFTMWGVMYPAPSSGHTESHWIVEQWHHPCHHQHSVPHCDSASSHTHFYYQQQQRTAATNTGESSEERGVIVVDQE